MRDGVKFILIPITRLSHWSLMVVDIEKGVLTLVDSNEHKPNAPFKLVQTLWYMFRDDVIPEHEE